MYTQVPTRHRRPPTQRQPSHSKRYFSYLLVAALLIIVIRIAITHSSSAIPEVKSGIIGYCLDDHRGRLVENNPVDSWSCNGTAAQNWTVAGDTITHDKNYCLSVAGNGSQAGDKIVLADCDGSSGQVWASAVDGLENPDSGRCLAIPSDKTSAQLTLASCGELTLPNEAWQAAGYHKNDTAGASISCSGTEGQKVACYAAKQWVVWNSGTVNHSILLNDYSDDNGYEEWCADFISYVYQQAGYPFHYGERDGWDEYLAYNIQNQGGFTYHAAAGYTPRAGDVAYFDYSDGHVEIVAMGGTKPIFIYGDSGTTDPSTGNGDMAENSITNDGTKGQVIYYLSPS